MLGLFGKLNPTVFFLSLCFGLFMCYITNPVPEIIIKYPNPDDHDHDNVVTYIDEASNCYKYDIEKTSCPSGKVKELPIN